jgi:hypothetical protein
MIASFVTWVYNTWQQIPEAIQKGLRDAAIAAFGAVLALNLVFPGNVDQAKSEALIVLLAAAAAAWAVIRVEVLPPLLDWLLNHLNLYFTATVGGVPRLEKDYG